MVLCAEIAHTPIPHNELKLFPLWRPPSWLLGYQITHRRSCSTTSYQYKPSSFEIPTLFRFSWHAHYVIQTLPFSRPPSWFPVKRCVAQSRKLHHWIPWPRKPRGRHRNHDRITSGTGVRGGVQLCIPPRRLRYRFRSAVRGLIV